jgi:predicted nucleic-acid-binding Zn-ribbon protein
VIPATGHEFVDKVVHPTTTSEGYTEHTCSKCGYSYRDNYKDKLPEAHTHHYESKVTKEATCTESGVKTYTCPECGDTYDEDIPAKGHHWGTPSVTPATCIEDGERVYTCIDCGETKTETIKATGHSFKDTVIEPTIETEGYTEHICSKCGYSYKDNYKPRLEKKNIANAAVSVSKTKYTYTGKAIKPKVTATCDGKELIKDTDYTVSYKNCTDTGKATVTVKGKGSYEGSKSISYFIKPAKVKAKKFTSPKTKTVKLTWTKAEGNVTGYQVQIALNKKFTKFDLFCCSVIGSIIFFEFIFQHSNQIDKVRIGNLNKFDLLGIIFF